MFDSKNNENVSDSLSVPDANLLKENENKYRLIFENMVNGCAYHKIITDSDGKPVDYVFLEVNKSFEDLTGLKAENILGKTVCEAMPGTENDPADWIGRYGNVALNQIPEQFENYSSVLDKWFSISVYSPQKNYFVTIFENITKRKNMEEELWRSEEKFKTIVTNTQEIIFMIDNDGIFTLSEGAGLSKLGLKPNQIVGLSIFDLYKDYPVLLKGIREAFQGKTVITESEVENNFFKNSYSPHYDKEGDITGLIGLSFNITELKQAEIDLQNSKNQLEQLVDKRTEELKKKNQELDDALKVFVGRELSIKQLQKRVKVLEGKD